MRASYIPARNPEYVASHAVIANQPRSDFINFCNNLLNFCNNLLDWKRLGSSNINDYNDPVFTAQSHLPCYRHTSSDPHFESVLYITELAAFISVDAYRDRAFFSLDWRKKTFSQRKKQSPTETRLRRKIYVSPFQFKPSNERGGRFVRE
jgi:hypothetical protein